ncbi:MAG TPA: histidinol-phosphate transaminase [candidate division Zixibacteria bacterium]|nr:histidinol-phosphate transaminase [candidate division Zixibacteria bacterium]
MIKIPEFVKKLRPYRAGKPIEELAREKNLNRIVKLASNENPLGPSPKATEAIRAALPQLHRYTDPLSHDLVQAIAAKYDVQPQHIVCGHGTDSLIAYIVNAFTEEEDEILTSEGTFIGLYVNAQKFGRTVKRIPLKNYGYDLKAIRQSITDKTRMIYLANPNNPTGTMFGKTEFESFMAAVPDDIMVILDEAYTTYAAENPNYPNGVRYDYENMVVTRTLSKAYGLGGLRVGFAVGPDEVINALYKVKLPFEPNLLAQVGAIAALDDDEFLARTVKLNKESLKIMAERFDALGLAQVPTSANFIMLVMPDENFTDDFYLECLNRGLIIRPLGAFGIPNGIRINSGTIDETEFALKIIEEVYGLLLKKYPNAAKMEKGKVDEARIV